MLHDDAFLKAEDALLGLKECPPERIKAFCNPFFDRHERHLMRPFMHRCDVAELAEPPDNDLIHLGKIEWLWRQEKDRYGREERGLAGDEPDTKTYAPVDEAQTRSFVLDFPAPGTMPPNSGNGSAGGA